MALRLTIDKTGLPANIEVVHGLGLGLDEKAVEADQKTTGPNARCYEQFGRCDSAA